jgi:hypothetical protein
MTTTLPSSPQARAGDEDVRAEAEEHRRYHEDQRAAILEDLCRPAAELVGRHPDPARTLAFRDPIPADPRVARRDRIVREFGET